MTALTRPSSTCTSKLQAHPLVTSGAPQEENSEYPTVIEMWSLASGGWQTPRQTGRLTFHRKMISNSTKCYLDDFNVLDV
jgi:hypothetical protein